ncbi:uncharacterized protein HaLaN_07057, partial [Haematococcus lacustris]
MSSDGLDRYFSIVALFIIFRETIEASLIVSVLLQFLSRSFPQLRKQGKERPNLICTPTSTMEPVPPEILVGRWLRRCAQHLVRCHLHQRLLRHKRECVHGHQQKHLCGIHLLVCWHPHHHPGLRNAAVQGVGGEDPTQAGGKGQAGAGAVGGQGAAAFDSHASSQSPCDRVHHALHPAHCLCRLSLLGLHLDCCRHLLGSFHRRLCQGVGHS